jgi:dipeptidyl-peptidase-3
VASAVSVITAVGDGGPGCALGVNLPNEEEIREEFGSKSVTMANVLRAYDAAAAEAAVEEFALPGEVETARRNGGLVNFLQTSLHEVLGHASGAAARDLAGDPAAILGGHYNALEEARAELVALHAIWDPRLRELGIITSDEIPRAAYQAYARSALLMLRRVKIGDVLQDDHMRATALIVGFLTDAGAVERMQSEGKTYFRVASFEQMRAEVAVLLAEVQRIKSTGDVATAEKLVQAYAVRIDTGLRDEVVERAAAADLPDAFAAVMPRLELVRDAGGQVQDVRAHHDEDLAAQMLRFAALGREAAP